MTAKSKAAANKTSKQQKAALRHSKLEFPLRTTLLYLLFGALWILLSDQILSFLVPDSAQQVIYQTLKGWFFILVSGILLYLLLLRDFVRGQQSKKALRTSEERYRLITQNSQDLIWTMNLDLQLTYVSPMVAWALGYSEEEILASPPERFLTPESYSAGLKVFREEWEQARVKPDPNYNRTLELEYCRRNGSTFWVEMKFSFFRDLNDQVSGVLGMGRDITERKQAEQETEWLASFPEQNPNPILEIDSTGTVFYMNPAAQRKFSDLKAQGFKHPCLAGLEDVIARFQQEGTNELQRDIEINNEWYSQSLYYLPEASRLRVYGTEITKRKQAEDEIYARSRQLTALLGASQSLTESLNLAEVLQRITDKTTDVLGIERTAIYLTEGEQLYLGASTPPLPAGFPVTFRSAMLTDHPHIAQAVMTGKSVVLSDATSAPLTLAEQAVSNMLGLRTILYVPLVAKKDAIGVLILGTAGIPREFSKSDRDLAHTLSNQAVLAITNAKLYEDLRQQLRELENQISERQQAEKALHENEERLRLSLQAANQGFYDLNVQTGEAIVNRQYAEMLGYDPETFVETNAAWIERLHPDDRASVAKIYEDYISGRLPEYRVEFRQRMKDGGWKWLLSLGKVIGYDAEGKPLRMLGTHTDIDERKRAENALRESEERFRLLFENNHAAMMLIEPVSGNIQNANRAAAEFYGYPLSELCSMNINAINTLPPDETKAERMRALEQKRNFFNFQHRLANGELRSVEVHSAPMEVDDHTLLFSIVYDVTERKRAEEQIRRQLKHLSALRMIDIAISSSFDLHVILDVILQQVLTQLQVDASAVLFINPQLQTIEYAASRGFHSNALQYTQLKLGEGYAGSVVLERKTIHISALMETGGKLTKALQSANEGFVAYYGVPLMVKGEVKGVLEIYQRSYRKVDSEWLEFLEALAGQAAIAIDNAQLFENLQLSNFNLERRVTERTAELNRTNAELEHANRVKDEFLANMSHELRTPLTSILGLSESLLEQRRGSLNDHQRRSLEIVESSGRHLLELINDILDLSKIEAGKFDYYPQPLLVDEICRSSLSFIKIQAARKSIAVSYIQDRSVSKIYADPRRLKQILVNLLTNAVKFTLENGEVILQVNSDLEQDLIKISVIDNGIGIAPENLRRLFQPFVQVDSSLNRQYEGTGLGLALVQKLTDLHGGSVQVESAVGKGSRFTINLPCLQEEMAKLEKLEIQPGLSVDEQAQTSTLPMEGPAHRGLILLADDNMPSILTIGEYMENHGYEVLAAHDGLEAIQKAETYKPDVILMDIQMPSMNGLEAIAHLRGNPDFMNTPIIALTALTMPGDRERSLLAGANEYMSKPVSLNLLARTIHQMLGRQAR